MTFAERPDGLVVPEHYRVDQEVGPASNIVVIGGGTGLSTVVEGLSNGPYHGEGVTGVVTTFDDGGSTGEIRRVYGIPAVGDVRQILRAMSRLSPDALDVFETRFDEGEESELLQVHGHTLGNLAILRAIQIEMKKGGTFTSALSVLNEIYRAKGKVLPVSDDVRTLRFRLADGSIIHGEHEMEESKHIKQLLGTDISFVNPLSAREKSADISGDVEDAIDKADIVVLAPGDLYTSIAPNLVVRGMKEALKKAKFVIMITNLMNRGWHTDGYAASTYAHEYERFMGKDILGMVILNSEELDEDMLYEQRHPQDGSPGSNPVEQDADRLEKSGYEVLVRPLLSRKRIVQDPNDRLQRSGIRHDPHLVAATIHEAHMRRSRC